MNTRIRKVAAFVYQDKGGYFVFFEQKQGVSRIIGPPSGLAAFRRLGFSIFGVKKLVCFCLYFTEIKCDKKGKGGRI